LVVKIILKKSILNLTVHTQQNINIKNTRHYTNSWKRTKSIIFTQKNISNVHYV